MKGFMYPCNAFWNHVTLLGSMQYKPEDERGTFQEVIPINQIWDRLFFRLGVDLSYLYYEDLY